MIMTNSENLAYTVLTEEEPYDYGWIKYVYRNEGMDGLRNIAKATIEGYAPENASKQLIGRAATIVANRLCWFVN